VYLVLAAITSQLDGVGAYLSTARDTIARWLTDIGVDRASAADAKEHVSATLSAAIPALLDGIGSGLKGLSSLVVFLGLTALSLLFLLKDGPMIRRWAERHMRVPPGTAHEMGDRVLESLRGYFVGVTFVAVFNAVVVGLGALLLGVPLAGSIAAVTFLGAYIPYLGAWSAGVFGVLVALGGAGADAALGMIVLQLLANGILQQLVQPIAYGAALGIHPLAVLIVTIAGGSLFGAVGLILAAPLTSAVTRIAGDLSARPDAAPTGVYASPAAGR
jgi:putative heme transporter